MDTQLLGICGVAFLAVFFLLGFFAVVMSALTTIFPAEPVKPPQPANTSDEAAVLAAVTAALAHLHPDKRITDVEELSS